MTLREAIEKHGARNLAKAGGIPWRTVYAWADGTNRPLLNQAVAFHESLQRTGMIGQRTTLQEFFSEQIKRRR